MKTYMWVVLRYESYGRQCITNVYGPFSTPRDAHNYAGRTDGQVVEIKAPEPDDTVEYFNM